MKFKYMDLKGLHNLGIYDNIHKQGVILQPSLRLSRC